MTLLSALGIMLKWAAVFVLALMLVGLLTGGLGGGIAGEAECLARGGRYGVLSSRGAVCVLDGVVVEI